MTVQGEEHPSTLHLTVEFKHYASAFLQHEYTPACLSPPRVCTALCVCHPRVSACIPFADIGADTLSQSVRT